MIISKRAVALSLAAWAAVLISGAALAAQATAPDSPPSLSFEDEQREAGREFWGVVDGHKDCWAEIGDTSYVECRDGYLTSS
ncbi:hypothetical protein [Streptomyces sp. DT117]|uniref:hypothetical protein n=1 Tax=Streptomyces sp. DT117 TaxID=3393422 RepID=UPI003CF0EB90